MTLSITTSCASQFGQRTLAAAPAAPLAQIHAAVINAYTQESPLYREMNAALGGYGLDGRRRPQAVEALLSGDQTLGRCAETAQAACCARRRVCNVVPRGEDAGVCFARRVESGRHVDVVQLHQHDG